MISDEYNQSNIIDEDSELDYDNAIEHIIRFITKTLIFFKINFQEVIDGKEEVCYNKQLLYFLDRNIRIENLPYIIEGNQINEVGSFPDMEFLEIKSISNKSFFDIECKRLNSNLEHVKQYIKGKTGGIQRFKENCHGVDMNHSAMIGYVENEDYSYWYTTVNSWIKEKAEHLTLLEKTTIYKLLSIHPKIIKNKKAQIQLYHFWIQIG